MFNRDELPKGLKYPVYGEENIDYIMDMFRTRYFNDSSNITDDVVINDARAFLIFVSKHTTGGGQTRHPIMLGASCKYIDEYFSYLTA